MSDQPDIAGPGGPHDRASLVVNTRNAIRLEDLVVAKLERPGEETTIALLLAGSVNATGEPGRSMTLLNADGAAAVVTEIAQLAGRIGGQFAADFERGIDRRDRS